MFLQTEGINLMSVNWDAITPMGIIGIVAAVAWKLFNKYQKEKREDQLKLETIISDKEKEIQRLNDLRVQEQKEFASVLIDLNDEALERFSKVESILKYLKDDINNNK